MATTKKSKSTKVVTLPAVSPFKRPAVVTIGTARHLGDLTLSRAGKRGELPAVRWTLTLPPRG